MVFFLAEVSIALLILLVLARETSPSSLETAAWTAGQASDKISSYFKPKKITVKKMIGYEEYN